MHKETTGIKDRNRKVIHVGDTVKCDHPIFIDPKLFVVEWDDAMKKYNLPSNPDLLAHCEIVQVDG